MLAYAKEQLSASSDLRSKYNKLPEPAKRYTDAEMSEKLMTYNVVNDAGDYEVPHIFTSTMRTLLSTDVDANIVGTNLSNKINFAIDTTMDKLKRVLIIQSWPVLRFNKAGMDSVIKKQDYECEMKLCDHSGFLRYETTELKFFDRTFVYDSYDALLRSVAEERDPEYLDKCVGNDDIFTSWHQYIPTHTTRTPTKFGFEGNDTLSLPLLYITSDVSISLKVRDIFDLVQVRYRYKTGDDWSEWKMLPRNKINSRLFEDFKMADPKLYVTYSKLSAEQRDRVFRPKKEFRLPFMMYKNNDLEISSQTDRATVVPKKCNAVKHYVVVQNIDAEKLNDYTNFTDCVDKTQGWTPYTNILVKYDSSIICEIPHEIMTVENVRYYCSGRPRVKGFGVIGFQEERSDKPFDPTHVPIEEYQFLFGTTNIYELSRDKTVEDDEEERKSNYKILFRTVCQGELVFTPTEKFTHDGRQIFNLSVVDF